MAAWILLAFVLGLAIGAAGSWHLIRSRPAGAPPPAVRRPELPQGARAPDDSMSLTAQRLVSDLERKYEGVTAAGAEEPKAPRRKSGPRTTRRRPPKS
jgi:hypothetical protein